MHFSTSAYTCIGLQYTLPTCVWGVLIGTYAVLYLLTSTYETSILDARLYKVQLAYSPPELCIWKSPVENCLIYKVVLFELDSLCELY